MIKTSQQQFIDSVFGIRDLADPSKLGQFDASAISAATARVLAFPNASGTIALQGWTEVNFLSLDGITGPMTGNLSLGGNSLYNVGNLFLDPDGDIKATIVLGELIFTFDDGVGDFTFNANLIVEGMGSLTINNTGSDNSTLIFTGVGGETGTWTYASDEGELTWNQALIVGSYFLANGAVTIPDLDGSSGIYTAAGSTLTSSIPTTGALGYLQRTGTLLTTTNAGDNLTIGASGTITGGTITDGTATLTGGNLTNIGTISVNNSGIHILDIGADHDLIFASGENLGQDTTLSILLNDADRAVIFAGDSTINAGIHLDHAHTKDAALVLWLRGDDEAGGKPIDLGSAGNLWTYVDNAAQVDGGVMGKAFSFDGTLDQINGDSPTGLPLTNTARTIAFWLKDGNAGVSVKSWLGYGTNNAQQKWVMRTENGVLKVIINAGNSTGTSTVLNDGNWHHVAVTFDPDDGTGSLGDAKFYVDGALDINSANAAVPNTTNSFLTVGIDDTFNPVTGKMDDVRVYSRALTPAEILELYELGTLDAMTALTSAYFKEFVASRSGHFNHLHAMDAIIDTGEITTLTGTTITASGNIQGLNIIALNNLTMQGFSLNLGDATESEDVIITFVNSDGTGTLKWDTTPEFIFSDDVAFLGGISVTGLINGDGNTTLGNAAGDTHNIHGVTKIGDGGSSHYTQFSATGVQIMVGTARVIKHLHFTMELGKGQNAPAERFTENPYVSYTYGIGDDSHLSREAPDDMDYTEESIIKVHWYTTDATANGDGDEIRWEVQWASQAVGEDITAGDTTDNSGDIVCSAANIIIETAVETIPANSIVKGDMIGIHVERVGLGGAGTDPQVNTIHILDVELQYTSNKLGEVT